MQTENGQRHYVYSAHSRVVAVLDGPEMQYTVPDDFPFGYVRIECWGPGDAMAWTQPRVIEKP